MEYELKERGVIPVLILAFALIISISLVILYRAKKQSQRGALKLEQVQLALDHSEIQNATLKQQLKLTESKMQKIFEDPVTHVLGWKIFEDRVTQSIKESERYQFTPGLLLIEIDHLKMIQNALDKPQSHELLEEIARRLQSCIRQVDSISRFKEDTFAILLAQLTKPETAAIVAERILQILSQVSQISEHALYITASIGIAISPVDGHDHATLIRSADHALQVAKEKGKHVYQFYQENMQAQSKREWALYTSIGHESFFQSLTLYYQPIHHLVHKNIFCMDTMVYWQHTQLGLISPRELFHYAEKQHKLNIITEWMIKEACKQFLHWRTLGFHPNLLAVPVSVKQLESQFIYRLSQLLQGMNFNPEWLLLEIREDFTQVPLEALEKAINMLNYLQIKIAVDDFGASAFSLYHLKQFPIHYLKLDRFLIENVESDPRALEIIQSILYLARKLEIEVMVQGVESEKQLTVLRDAGCVLMQGQALGEPLSSIEMT